MFEQVYNLLNKAQELSLDETFKAIVNDEVKLEIIRLNTEEQLYKRGEDSKGSSLGDYAPYTVTLKRFKGQPTDRITLKDSGDFYRSFRVEVYGDKIVIDGDSIKGDNDLVNMYGEDIYGLNEANMELLREMLLPKIKSYVKTKLGL